MQFMKRLKEREAAECSAEAGSETKKKKKRPRADTEPHRCLNNKEIKQETQKSK